MAIAPLLNAADMPKPWWVVVLTSPRKAPTQPGKSVPTTATDGLVVSAMER
ncbi:MAG: hypothetical protein H6895_03690 [Defluviimonas sp.]|nr:hypothetical protein [Paracoccaceae bacterium]MCC0063174.1 hypothetical protein [Defluviimonas sp.]